MEIGGKMPTQKIYSHFSGFPKTKLLSSLVYTRVKNSFPMRNSVPKQWRVYTLYSHGVWTSGSGYHFFFSRF